MFEGRAPQIRDWLDAWSEVTEKMAFRKQERLTLNKHTREHTSLRRNRKQQLQIIAEARRRDIRLQLRAATCISFAMGDRKSQQIIRYRCDVPDYPYVQWCGRRHELEEIRRWRL